MVHGSIIATGLATLAATVMVVLAHRQTALAAGGGYQILRGEALTRARWSLRLMSYFCLAAIAASTGVVVHALGRVDAMSVQVAALQDSLARAQAVPAIPAAPAAAAAPAPVQAPVPVPAPVEAAAIPAASRPAPPRAAPIPPPSTLVSREPVAPASNVAVVRTGDNGKLLVRDAPGGQVLGSVPDGTLVVVLGRSPAAIQGRTWTHLRATGRRTKGQIQGWAASEFIVEAQSVASR